MFASCTKAVATAYQSLVTDIPGHEFVFMYTIVCYFFSVCVCVYGGDLDCVCVCPVTDVSVH